MQKHDRSYLLPLPSIPSDPGEGKTQKLPSSPSFSSQCEIICVSHVHFCTDTEKSGECCPIQKKKTLRSFSIKLLTLKRDISVIDSVLMVWVDFSSLCCEDVVF